MWKGKKRVTNIASFFPAITVGNSPYLDLKEDRDKVLICNTVVDIICFTNSDGIAKARVYQCTHSLCKCFSLE